MSQRFAAALSLATVLAVSACAAPEGAMMGTAEDEAAIRQFSDQYVAAFAAGDAAAAGMLVTEDYQTVMPDGTMQSGRAAFQASVAEEMAMMPPDMNVTMSGTTDMIRWINATTAVAAGTWSATGMPAGAGPDRGSWLAVMRKDADGMWRMAHGMSAPYMTPPTMPDSTGS